MPNGAKYLIHHPFLRAIFSIILDAIADFDVCGMIILIIQVDSVDRPMFSETARVKNNLYPISLGGYFGYAR